MRQNHWLGLIVTVILCLLTWGFWPTTFPDPVVRGRPLSDWLDRQGPAGLPDESVKVVQSLGPDVVPTLLAWLDLGDTLIVREIRKGVGAVRIPIDVPGYTNERKRAVLGFRALGPAGRSAWPEIAALALHAPDENQRADAINSLTSADATAARLLAVGATDPDREVRLRAIHAISCLHLAADEVSYPTLERLRADPDPAVRASAKRAISFMDTWLANSVVALKAASPESRAWEAQLIGDYATHARALLPDLEVAANDPDPTVRATIAEAIRRVKSVGP